MTTTIVGSVDFPTRENAAIVQIKSTWGGAWQTDHTIRLGSASLHVCAHGLDVATFMREYGDDIAHPHDAALGDYNALDIAGWWIRVGFTSGAGATYTWVGRIEVEQRVIYGVADTPTGEQSFHAYGPLNLLRKLDLRSSVWNRSGAVEIPWVPDMNAQDRFGLIEGNRSSSTVGDSYVFEATGTSWTRRQLLDYLVVRHLNTAGGPAWTVGGQADLLDGITDFVPLSGAGTAEQAINMICSRDLGISWRIAPTADGFEINIFALLAEEVSFGGATLPANPATFTFKSGENLHHLRTTVTTEKARRYGTIRVTGERAIICTTLDAAAGDLEGKWGSGPETTYKAGTGTSGDDPLAHDRARQGDNLRAVYTHLGAPAAYIPPPITVGSDGTVAEEASPYQGAIRRTLAWTPLREDHDYTTNPATDNSPAGHVADFRPPAAYLKRADGTYVQAEREGFALAAPANDWGIIIRGDQPHRMAKNHWSGANCTITEPEYDYEEVVATIAYESDVRLQLTYSDPDGADGTVLEIRLPGAHLWYLAPGTVVGLTEANGLESSGAGRVLRNDANRLELAMAGAIARYGRDRHRAEIVLEGLHPIGELLGQVLAYVQSTGSAQGVEAVVTSVSWSNGQTTIKAGFAR